MQIVDLVMTPRVNLATAMQRQEAADMTAFHLRAAIIDFLAMEEAARVEQLSNVSPEVRKLLDWIKDCEGSLP